MIGSGSTSKNPFNILAHVMIKSRWKPAPSQHLYSWGRRRGREQMLSMLQQLGMISRSEWPPGPQGSTLGPQWRFRAPLVSWMAALAHRGIFLSSQAHLQWVSGKYVHPLKTFLWKNSPGLICFGVSFLGFLCFVIFLYFLIFLQFKYLPENKERG